VKAAEKWKEKKNMPRLILSQYLIEECSATNNSFLQDPAENYFDPLDTLNVVIITVSISMIVRRVLRAIWIVLESCNDGFSAEVDVLRSLREAVRLPDIYQEHLRQQFNKSKKLTERGMPELPNFAVLEKTFDEWYGGGRDRDESTESGKSDARAKRPSVRFELRDTIMTTKALQQGEEWMEWFDQNVRINKERKNIGRAMVVDSATSEAEKKEQKDLDIKIKKALCKNMYNMVAASKGTSQRHFNRDLTRIIFLLVLLVAIGAACEYGSSDWPQGSFYFCQLPYLVAITSFKPFAVPMYYVLTVVAHHSFVEMTFQHAPELHEPTGALKFSPLPRGLLSLSGIWLVGVSFTFWFAAMLVVCVVPFVYFAPVILVTVLVLPLVFTYLPASILDGALYGLRHWAKLPVSLTAGISFDETVLVLKGSTTQIISIALLALPMVRVWRGGYSYADATRDVLQPILDFGDLRTVITHLQFVLTWPNFTVPRLGYYLGASAGLVFFDLLLKLMRKVTDTFDFYSPLLGSPGKTERLAQSFFTWITWRPFRAFSDLVRTASTATFEARHDFKKVMYGGYPQRYLGSSLGYHVNAAPNALLVAIGPFLVAAKQPCAKVFSEHAEDDDVVAFMNDEESMAYYEIICRSKQCGADSLEAILKSAWLHHLDLSFCDGIAGDLGVLQIKCRNLSKLKLANCKKITGKTSDLQHLIKLEELILSDCPGISGKTRDLNNLTRMTSLRLDYNQQISGSLIDFSSLTLLVQLVIKGCKKIKGSTENLTGLTQLKTLQMTGCTGIEGSVADFSKLIRLKDLWVCESISGSLKDFSNLTLLKTLQINGCKKIEGSTKDLTGLTQLEILKMTGCTDIEGSVADFSKLIRLKDLWVCESISGSLKDFSNLTLLKTLQINGCKSISGHLLDLLVLKRLNVLNYDGTSVDGSADDLKQLTRGLERLKDPKHSKNDAGTNFTSMGSAAPSLFAPVSDHNGKKSGHEKGKRIWFSADNPLVLGAEGEFNRDDENLGHLEAGSMTSMSSISSIEMSPAMNPRSKSVSHSNPEDFCL